MKAQSEQACASAVMMVRPACFGANAETSASNRFQHPGGGDAVAAAARAESDALAALLEARGVEVFALEDCPLPAKPDACFPNNWVSLHGDGTVVLYPMLAPNRRHERSLDLLGLLRQRGGFEVSQVIDLSHHESAGRFLEGTGSLVLDRPGRCAYACLSPRTDAGLLAEFAGELGYRSIGFRAVDGGGVPVYHTNVLMSLGERFAVLCEQAVPDQGELATLRASIEVSGRELIPISLDQMQAFAGNLLQLASSDGGRVIAVSATAWSALDAGQRRRLESHGEIAPASIPTIERHGGGSVRCMLAEVFLPRRLPGTGC